MSGTPIYVTISSCGPGKWNAVDTAISPPVFAWQFEFVSTSAGSTANGGFNLEGTVDNPFVYGSSFGGTGGLAVSPSSQAPAPFLIGSQSSNGLITTSTLAISAWRINQQSSGLSATISFLQAGRKQ